LELWFELRDEIEEDEDDDDDDEEASFGESEANDDEDEEVKFVIGWRDDVSSRFTLVDISMLLFSLFSFVVEFSTIGSLWESSAKVVDDWGSSIFVDSNWFIWVCDFSLSSSVRLAFKDESVSRQTVGGSGFGIGFSTGFVRPSFISWTLKKIDILNLIYRPDIEYETGQSSIESLGSAN